MLFLSAFGEPVGNEEKEDATRPVHAIGVRTLMDSKRQFDVVRVKYDCLRIAQA